MIIVFRGVIIHFTDAFLLRGRPGIGNPQMISRRGQAEDCVQAPPCVECHRSQTETGRKQRFGDEEEEEDGLHSGTQHFSRVERRPADSPGVPVFRTSHDTEGTNKNKRSIIFFSFFSSRDREAFPSESSWDGPAAVPLPAALAAESLPCLGRPAARIESSSCSPP